MSRKKVAVLTGGGDTSALNATLKGIAIRVAEYSWELIGFIKGWAGLLDAKYTVLTPEIIEVMRTDAQLAWQIGCVYALVGEEVEAMNWLEDAADRGFINYPLLAEHDPFLRKFRGDERYEQFLDRIKYEWEHFDD